MRRAMSRPIRAVRRAAFTLFELLVVIVVILALIAVTVPSFGTLLESTNFSSAVNAVTGTLGNARALAISNSKPVGVAFLFDTEEEEYTLQIVELFGTRARLTDQVTATPGQDNVTWSLRPAVNTTPVVLPKGFAVYGLSFVHLVGDPDDPTDPNSELNVLVPADPPTYLWYAGEQFRDPDRPSWLVNPWIFPRNDPRLFLDPDDLTPVKRSEGLTLDEVWRVVHGQSVPGVNIQPVDAEIAVRHANSFVVMYDSVGTIISVYDGGGDEAEPNFYLELPGQPVDAGAALTARPEPYDSEFRFDPESIGDGSVEEPTPNPEVVLRTVNQLAVVSLQRLSSVQDANGDLLGVDRPWELHPATSRAPWPDFRGTAQAAADPLNPTDPELNELVVAVTRWIDQNAEIIGFDRYTGAAQRRSALQ